MTLAVVPVVERRARRHPWVILALYAWQSALALLVATPAASLVGAAYGIDHRGDAPLWAPGGRALLDFAWHEQHGLGAIASTGQAILLVALIAGSVPTAAALVAMAHADANGRKVGFVRSVAEGLRAFPALLAVLVAASLALGALGLFAVEAREVVEAWCHEPWGEAAAQQIAAVAVLPVLVAGSVVLVVADVARAAVVRFAVGARRGLAYGFVAFQKAPLATWWGWAWRALVSVVPVGAVALLGHLLPGLLLFVLHQGVVLGRVALKASWWARALRGVEVGAPPAPLAEALTQE